MSLVNQGKISIFPGDLRLFPGPGPFFPGVLAQSQETLMVAHHELEEAWAKWKIDPVARPGRCISGKSWAIDG